MYKKILVPLDGSATSKRGFEEALKLVRAEGTRLRLLNVVDEGMIPATTPIRIGKSARADIVKTLKASGARALKDAAARAAKARVEVECAQRTSGARRISEVILDEARKWRAELIVMGTHGRRGLNRLILGSDAERVLQDTPVPVLLVRAEDSQS